MTTAEHKNRSGRFNALVIAALAIFYALGLINLSEGHNWGGDFALYIAHAQNIVSGSPYSETLYLPNTLHPYLSPVLYPPGTPLILAGIMHFTSDALPLLAMKGVLLLFFTLSLLFVHRLYRQRSHDALAALVVFITLLSPYVWQFKESILSEFPFMLLLYMTLHLLMRHHEEVRPNRRLMLALSAGITAYLAYATREVALVLIPAALLFELFQKQRISRSMLLFLGTFLLGFSVQRLMVDISAALSYGGAGGGYEALVHGWSYIAVNLPVYFKIAHELIPIHSIHATWVHGTMLVLLLFAGVGIVAGWMGHATHPGSGSEKQQPPPLWLFMKRIPLDQIFFAGYLLVHLLQPFGGTPRYLLPVLPIFLFYMLQGVALLLRPMVHTEKKTHAILWTVALLCMGNSVVVRSLPDEMWIKPGIHQPQSVALFQKVRQLPPDAVVLFRKPRVMALFGERRSAIWPRKINRETLHATISQLKVTHLVVAKPPSGLHDPPLIRRFIASSLTTRRLFDNTHFTLYHLKG